MGAVAPTAPKKKHHKLFETSLCSASSVGSQHDAARICQCLQYGTRSYRSISAAHASAQQQTHRPPMLLSIDGTDKRADRCPTVT